METTINWPKILDRKGLAIQYRACSARHAWRKPTKHDTLQNALFSEEYGARELFREGSKLHRERSQAYGVPHFVTVWIDGESWALLIKERVAGIISVSDIQKFEGSRSKKSKIPEFINQWC